LDGCSFAKTAKTRRVEWGQFTQRFFKNRFELLAQKQSYLKSKKNEHCKLIIISSELHGMLVANMAGDYGFPFRALGPIRWDNIVPSNIAKEENLVCLPDGALWCRLNLINVLLLVDASVPTQNVDLGCAEWLHKHEVPYSLVFTKADKRKKKCPLPAQNIATFEVHS
jgi:GTP-binding protein EngB required for normal cell division